MYLNFGSGLVMPEGWVNFDKVDHGQPLVGDILDGLPFDDGQFDHIVANHSLQMIRFDDLGRALAELYRVLKPGGTLRVLVPDAKLAILRWELRFSEFPISADLEPTKDGQFLRYLFWHGDARSAFTNTSLMDTLRRVGFTSMEQCPPGATFSCDIKLVELDSRQDESLIVEAQKPEV